MKKTRAWSGAAIRKLARDRVQAEQGGLLAKPSLDVPFSRTPVVSKIKTEIFESSAPEFIWGRFERSYGRCVLSVVPQDLLDAGEEMARLCQSLGLEVLDTVFVKMPKRIQPSTFLSSNVLESIQAAKDRTDASAIVFELPLSPVQVRNLEDFFSVPVLDRQAVILSIFKHHAKTRLAKIQVEMAQLKYLQSRLSGIWMGLSRQSGGKGGFHSRGQGETRLELDRRVIKERLAFLGKKLKDAEKSVDVQSSRRQFLPRAALVGYTNAGKTTLMKRLTKANLLEEDQLFTTLDTTVRVMSPPTEPRILISDTVGFVRDLPHDLVLSFRSTLKEAVSSQILIHVLDISHPEVKHQFEVTESVLEEIGATTVDRVFVFNKVDKLDPNALLRRSTLHRFIQARFPGAPILTLSARTGAGVQELKNCLSEKCQAEQPYWEQTL